MLLNKGFPFSNDDDSDRAQKDSHRHTVHNDRVSDGVIDCVKREGFSSGHILCDA